MRSRGLGDAPAPEPTETTNAPHLNMPSAPATVRVEPEPGPEYPGFYAGYFGRMPELVPDAPDGADDEGPLDYTWKTVLCDCDTANKHRNSLQPCSRPESKAGFSSRANSAAAIHASLSLPTNSTRRAHLPIVPFHPRSPRSLRRMFPISRHPRALSAALQIRFLKASIPSIAGNVSNAAKNGPIQSRQGPQCPVRRPHSPHKRKEPPGNRAALSSGRIVPTEPKPLELSGCILGAGEGSVKRKCL